MLDHIKHSIVTLQIAKNMAHPINGLYQGPIKSSIQANSLPTSSANPTELGSELDEKSIALFVPEISYSSSEGEEDFYDANDELTPGTKWVVFLHIYISIKVQYVTLMQNQPTLNPNDEIIICIQMYSRNSWVVNVTERKRKPCELVRLSRVCVCVLKNGNFVERK